MKIAMFTNTYLPHVGGVARSVSSFANAYRKLGHACLVIAPEFEDMPEDHPDVLRVPAITNFNDSGFSLRLPFMGDISETIEAFKPDIVHAHHPFLLGDTALRVAYARELPLVFTHHTLYERYTDYLPVHGEYLQRAASEMATQFANACSLVFAPSQSLAELIVERGVETPVTVQPTGIDVAAFRAGKGDRFRRKLGIPKDAPIVGHVGRIAAEKNLAFLVEACCDALETHPAGYVVLVGSGDQMDHLRDIVASRGLSERIAMPGPMQGEDLADAYASFDLFAFASQSETQGLVLAEAMASGTPVVALDGPGVRDVLTDGENGRLLAADASRKQFAEAVSDLLADPKRRNQFSKSAAATADRLDHESTAVSALNQYAKAIKQHEEREESNSLVEFDKFVGAVEAEYQLFKVKVSALTSAIGLEFGNE